MKKFFSALTFLFLFFGASAVSQAQIDPSYQIKWPDSCTAGLVYSPFSNSCIAIGGGTTTFALTAAASGGAAPGTTFNGGSAITFDYHSFGAPSVSGVNATGTWFISILGNAATATAFATTPTTCSTGQFATGIDINGNAICGSSNVQISIPSGIITSTTCTSPQTQALTGVRSTSTFTIGYATNPNAVIGWGAQGGLVLNIWPDASNDVFDWSVCNQSAGSITAGAISISVGVK